MKNKSFFCAILCAFLFSMNACGQSEQIEETSIIQEIASSEESSISESIEITETQTQTVTRTVSIYHGNDTMDGLVAEQIEMETVTPEGLIEVLSKYGMISNEVTVASINEKEENDEKTIYVSFSSQMRDFFSGNSEYNVEIIRIASITNTFLDAYKADYFRFSVEGGNLETKNKLYNEPLQYFVFDSEDSVWEGYGYHLSEETVLSEDGMFAAIYPKIEGMEDEELQQTFNQMITNYISNRQAMTRSGTEMINYDIKYEDGNYISIVLRGEANSIDGTIQSRYAVSFNFDLTAKTNRRLKDYVDIGTVIGDFEVGANYELVGESKITTQQCKDYFVQGGNEDFMFLLPDYDFDIENPTFVPTGFTYKDKDEAVVLIMQVPNSMGDYIEIKLQ